MTRDKITSITKPIGIEKLTRCVAKLHVKDIAIIQKLSDAAVITILFALIVRSPIWVTSPGILPAWAWVLSLTFFILPSCGAYYNSRKKNLWQIFRKISDGWTLTILILVLISFLSNTLSYFSRTQFALWGLISWLYLIIHHIIIRKYIRRNRASKLPPKHILYWGNLQSLKKLMDSIEKNNWMGYKICAWFGTNFQNINYTSQNIIFPQYMGGLESLKNWLKLNSPDLIYFSDTNEIEGEIESLLKIFGDTSIPTWYIPSWANPTMKFSTEFVGSLQCVSIWGKEQILFEKKIKRVVDIIFSIIILIITFPILAVCALAIKVSSKGPVIFCQYRYGLNGKKFKIYKLRTMHEVASNGNNIIKQVQQDDDRVTFVGKYLRKWSIDELPQLINVLRGEMSLVGPRPHAVEHNEMYRRLIPGYMQRHACLPGLTGLAQVEGFRGETSELNDMVKRIQSDLIYQRSWSLKKDIKIILLSVIRLKSPKAY